MKIQLKAILVISGILALNACATYKPQYIEKQIIKSIVDEDIAHSFYLIGDAGNSKIGTKSIALKAFEEKLNVASKNSTALFLGDNIYPKGLPKKGEKGRDFAIHQLKVQTNAVKNFKGHTIFIPGNHDWYSDGLEGLQRQEKYIEKQLGKHTFLPENGCPIKKVTISNAVVLIIIDSEWYLTNWDKLPTINDDCSIKTRAKFFDKLEGEIKKARGKTTIIALHHPMFTNGSHGGQYSLKSHMSPAPILGSLKNLIRKTGGVTTVDIQNKKYNTFRKRIITLAQQNDKAIFVSGHDHNLQYIVQDNLPQIISGSGSKKTATRSVGGGQFSYGSQGYARLDVLKDGSSYIRFYSAEDNKMVFQTTVLSADKKNIKDYDANFPKVKLASVYTDQETQKSDLYKTLWGNRYREDFSTKVVAPTVRLDTLFGGLTPVRKGGGHQSKSLRLKDGKGREYVMRALRKNAVQYLQAVAFKDQYIEGQFNGTVTEELLLDVFTGSHPYAPFTIGTLSDAVGIFHTNPVLYYIPKQNALGAYNEEFGDELYMIEERAANKHGDEASFGFSDKLISTDDFLEDLQKDEDYILDEAAYVRARLFDMLIGDWDRHEDQWRWAKFKEDVKTIYRPMPRDRDQAFSIMGDGKLLSLGTSLVPALRLMKPYKAELKHPKWFNIEPYPLDMALINRTDKNVWDAQVNHIVTHLTNQVIDDAFKYFPKEVNQNTIAEIKQKLIGRRANLKKISDTYYKHINKFAVIRGTHKDDWFDVKRLPNGKTSVTVYRIKKGKRANIFHKKTYTHKATKEIWIYGLDDKDVFRVYGRGNNLIKLRLIGGQNNDTYTIENDKKVKVYDYKSKPNTFTFDGGRKKLTNDYKIHSYNHKKLKNSTNQLIPLLGSNPDDGLKIGLNNTLTKYGFERNPFSSQHTLSAAYYFATKGIDLAYKAEFANVVEHWNLIVDTKFTSPNYAVNFFGFGNDSPNPEADENDGLNVNLDYNRIKLRTFKINPALSWHGAFGASFKGGLSFESNEIDKTSGRFIAIPNIVSNSVFEKQDFLGLDAKYTYKNNDNPAFPTLGFLFAIQSGYKNNLNSSKGYGYVIPELAFDYKLIPSGQLVLATKLKGQFNLGNNFEFYQAANLGANNGLRGYRNERFSGKSAFVQSTDLRYNLRKIKTGFLPLNIGFYGGIDYGRVWIDGDDSNIWNNSIGGGVFAEIAEMMTLNLSAFNSNDGMRLAFKLGFGF